MSALRGHKEFNWYKAGKKLTRGQAMKAKCYECNGEEESKADCEVDTCPMYQYRLYPQKAISMDSPVK